MFTADTVTFQEFMKKEPLPLSTIQSGVMEFLRGRRDVVLFGAQAVNAYVREPRMSEDVDLLCVGAEKLDEAASPSRAPTGAIWRCSCWRFQISSARRDR